MHDESTEPTRLACAISDTAGELDDILVAPMPEWPAGPWQERFRESRKRLATMESMLRDLEREFAAASGHTGADESASILRVTTMLDAEADAAPTPKMAALWRRLAANIRRELSGD